MLKLLKNRLIKNIGVYTLLNLLNSLIPFLLLPILTKYLSTYDYGVVDMFINLNFILLPLLGLNIGSSVIRFYFLDNIDFKKTIHVIISYILLFGVISIIIIFIFQILDFDFFKGNVPKGILLSSAIYVVFSQLVEVLLSTWRAEEKAYSYGFFRIVKTALDLGLSLYCIMILKLGWEGRVYPILFVSIFLGITSLIIIKKKFKLNIDFDSKTIKVILIYALPLIFHSLGGYLISFSDRFLILYFLDTESVGVYSVAYQIGMIMSFINNSFNQAYLPFLFSKLKDVNIKTLEKLKKINSYYFLFMLVLSFLIYLLVPVIYKTLIDKDFHVSSDVVLWVLLGYAFNGMYKIIGNFLFYYQKTKSIAYITVFSALVNVAFCLILIPRFGILGASISTAIAFAIMFLLVYVKYKKLDLHEKVN